MDDCPICCESFDKKKRKVTSCPFCDRAACLSCQKSNLLTNLNGAKCMFCAVAWNLPVLKGLFPSTFVDKEYRAIREKYLFDVETSLIPATQQFYAAYREKLQTETALVRKRDDLKVLRSKRDDDENTQDALRNALFLEDISERQASLKAKAFEAFKRIEESRPIEARLEKEVKDLELQMWRCNSLLKDQAKNSENRSLGMPCPYREGNDARRCRGYLDADMKCGICQRTVCKDCHTILLPDETAHKCDPAAVESIKLMRSDSKFCPKCSVLIHRIAGCDHMFCTACHTPFNWGTGSVLDGTPNNPHYFEWVRRNSAGPTGANHCHEDPRDFLRRTPMNQLVTGLRKSIASFEERCFFNNALRILVQVSEKELPNLHGTDARTIPHDPNRILRISYMAQEITEEQFKAALLKRDKEAAVAREQEHIWNTFLQVGGAVVQQILQTLDPDGDNVDILTGAKKGLLELRSYINQVFARNAQLFKFKPTYITEGYESLITIDRPKTPR